MVKPCVYNSYLNFTFPTKALCDRYHKDGPGILRDEEVQKAIRAVKSTNHMHFLSMVRTTVACYTIPPNVLFLTIGRVCVLCVCVCGRAQYLQQKNHEQVERHGPDFEQEFNDFLGEYSEDKIAAQFVKEGKVRDQATKPMHVSWCRLRRTVLKSAHFLCSSIRPSWPSTRRRPRSLSEKRKCDRPSPRSRAPTTHISSPWYLKRHTHVIV
jgi:hypothetical protein